MAIKMVSDRRFTVPLYTLSEAAAHLGVPGSTFRDWARGYPRTQSTPVVTSLDAPRNDPSVPFIGLAEGMVAAAFRQAGLSMQHLRRAVGRLQADIGIRHALASRRLYTDGAKLFYDYARSGEEDLAQLTVVLSGQRVFSRVIQDYLVRITYGEDGWAERLILPVTPDQLIEVDPKRAFGQPVLVGTGIRIVDVIDRFRAGESLLEVARDFGVERKDLEAVIRAQLRAAA